MFHGDSLDNHRLRAIHVRIIHLLSRGLQPSACYSTLSIIDLLLGNKELSVKYAREAMQSSDQGVALDSISFARATSALFAAALFDELFDRIDGWLVKHPHDSHVLKSAIMQSYLVSQFNRQLQYAVMLTQCPGTSVTDLQIQLSHLAEQNRALAAQCHLNESDILARLNLAVEVLQAADLHPKRIMRQVIDDGSFVLLLYIDADRERATDFTFKIFDALTDHFPVSAMELFSISCRPIDDWQWVGILKDQV